jgi:hypothetical protein
MTMYEDRVANGATLLDRVRPNWAREIAQDELAMATCDQCILGQLYGDYRVGFRKVLEPLSSRELFAASDLGFTLPGEEQLNGGRKTLRCFATLAEAWRSEIRRRLDAASAGDEERP